MSAPAGARSPWQRLYEAAHRRRAAYWSVRAERLPLPVWSVGNLHWGGTGKTPVVTAVAAWLRERGVRVAVLSRGYRRRGRGALVVSTGSGPLVDPERAGDEPWLLADALPGVSVAIGERRSDAARLLLATLREPPQLFLLDDGFSHLRLVRDLDLLVLPADDPLGGGLLPPTGRLREPLAGAARAHAVLLTGAGATPAAARTVAATLAEHGFAGPGFACPTAAAAPRLLAGPAPGTGEPLLLVTGVARPERVRQAAAALGLAVAGHLAFADHHRYPPRSLRRIRAAQRRLGAAGVLTTGKDRGKLLGRLPGPLLELPLAVEPEAALWEWLAGRLAMPGAAPRGPG